MKSKKEAKLLTALALILAIALAPVSTAVFAQVDDNANDVDDDSETVDKADSVSSNTDEASTEDDETKVDEKENKTDRKEQRKEKSDKIKEQIRDIKGDTKAKIKELKDQRAQKVRDFKETMADQYKDRLRPLTDLDVRPYEVDPDREPDLYFKGDTDGWAIIGGYAYDAATELAGEAYHIRDSTWKVHVTKGTISIGDRTAIPVELTGTAHGHRLVLHGTAKISEDVHVRIVLRGDYAPTQTQGVFALSLNSLGYHSETNSGRIPLAQIGEVFVEPNPNLPEPKTPIPKPAPINVPEILS